MSTKKPIIPTPANATREVHDEAIVAYTAHFTKILTPTIMLTNSKGCFATVINAPRAGKTLEEQLGTDNATVATKAILANIQASYSTVPA